MEKLIRRKTLITLFAMLFVVGMILTGCGSKNTDSGKDSGSTATEKDSGGKPVEKSKVTVWYLWGGREGQFIEDMIKRFNDSQDKYEAVGLSVPDEQKIKVAIAGGNGPDVTDSFASAVGKYAEEGILLPLDDLIERDKWDISDFVPSTLDVSRANGKLYALPLNIMTSVMYYNKKLLADAGYNEPPKSSRELLEVANKTTKVNENGTIEVLGFPAYPGYPFDAFMYSFGGEYFTKDKKAALDNPATLESLSIISEYIKKYGIDNIKQVQGSGKWLDATDPFLAGKQAIRIDGPWLSTYIKDISPNLDYGIAPLPYLEGHPELEGSNNAQSSIFYIAKNTKNVDGAWEFMKFLFSSKELAKTMGDIGNIPSRVSSMSDPVLDTMADIKELIKIVQNPNVKPYPNISQFGDITNKAIKDETDAVFGLKKSPEEGMKAMQKKTEEMLK